MFILLSSYDWALHTAAEGGGESDIEIRPDELKIFIFMSHRTND